MSTRKPNGRKASQPKRTAHARYDVLHSTAQKKRRQPSIERTSEDRQLKPYDRLAAINLCRDLERNFTSMRSIMHQLRVNVVGTGPKLRAHLRTPRPGDGVKSGLTLAAWSEWFNSTWTKDCDFRDGSHWATHVNAVLSAIIREGDILPWFDNGWIENSGKCGFFEADQLCTVRDPQNLPAPWRDTPCEQGVFFDKFGRALAYACSKNHGVQVDDAKNVTILQRGPVARLVKLAIRPNQLRGTPVMLTAAADMQDLYELRAKELQTAKAGATLFATVNKKDGGVGDVALRRGYDEATGPTDGATTEAGGLAAYDRLESLTGGAMEYLEDGESIEVKDFNRPSVNFREACDWVLRSSGAAFGITKTYSSMHTEASYTAFRGDLLIAWASFRAYQKELERQYCDWIAGNAIRWGLAAKALDAGGLTVEDVAFSWDWPKQPSPDPLKESIADENNLRNLLVDFSELIGPDWRKKLDAIAEQMRYAKDPTRQLPLAPWEGERTAITFTESK